MAFQDPELGSALPQQHVWTGAWKNQSQHFKEQLSKSLKHQDPKLESVDLPPKTFEIWQWGASVTHVALIKKSKAHGAERARTCRACDFVQLTMWRPRGSYIYSILS